MPHYPWLPQIAGGINTFDDPSSIEDRQLVTCSNYYPHGHRWRLIQGNSDSGTNVTTQLYEHMAEYQADDSSGGFNKYIMAAFHTGQVYRVGPTLGAFTLITTLSGTTTSSLWDHTIYQGASIVMANGARNNSGSGFLNYNATTGSVGVSVVAQTLGAGYVEYWKNRLFLNRPTVAGEVVLLRYSAEADLNTWTGSDAGTETIVVPVGDRITGIRSVENYLAIFTRRTITLLIGDHPDNWTKRTIYEDHGCASHRTIQKAFGGLLYANDAGVWFLGPDGQRKELSRDIRPYWQNPTALSTGRNKAQSANMHATYDFNADYNRYYIWVAEGASTNNTVGWIYHFNQNAWTKMDSLLDSGQSCLASCLRENTSGAIQMHFATGTSNTTTNDKKIYTIDPTVSSFATLTGGDIAASMTSKIFGGDLTAFDERNQALSLSSVKGWKNLYAKMTDQASSGLVTFDVTAHQDSGKALQRTTTVQFNGSGDIVRERVPLSVSGWGVQVGVKRTGQIDHDFMGGIIEYETTGRK